MIETVTSNGRKAVIAFADESALIVYVKEEPVNAESYGCDVFSFAVCGL